MVRNIWIIAATFVALKISPEITWLIIIGLFFSGALPLYAMYKLADWAGGKPDSENNRIH